MESKKRFQSKLETSCIIWQRTLKCISVYPNIQPLLGYVLELSLSTYSMHLLKLELIKSHLIYPMGLT